MRQLTFIKPGDFEWWDVASPKIAAETDAIVHPIAVARCDIDYYIATGAVKYPGPFAFGHEMVGEVIDVGEKVPFAPGDKVIVPFQLSCGRCASCRRGQTNACLHYPLGAAFGLKPTSKTEYGGALSDLVHVPFADHMLVPLPGSLAPVTAASISDNIADGWRGVGPYLKDRPGASVLVVGGLAKSIGLYAAGAAVALGAGRVLYLDDDADQRAVAESFGAAAEPLALDQGRSPTEPFDIVVEAAGNESALEFCFLSCGVNSVLTSVAIHFAPKTAIPLTSAYYKGITFHTSRVHSRAVLPDVISCVCGGFHPERVTNLIIDFNQAPDAMTAAGPKVIFQAG
jgi:alcohol dehydrogenase